MEIIKRKVDCREKERVAIKRIGINNLGVMSIVFDDVDDKEWLINLDNEEVNKLKEFLSRWD